MPTSLKPAIANFFIKQLAGVVDALTSGQDLLGAMHLQRSELAEAQALVDGCNLDNYDKLLKVALEYFAHVRPHIPPDLVEAAWVTLPTTLAPNQPAADATDVAQKEQLEETEKESKESKPKKKGSKDKDGAVTPPNKRAKVDSKKRLIKCLRR